MEIKKMGDKGMLLDTTGKQVDVNILKNKKIIFYGASTRNKNAIEALEIADNVIAFIDKDETKAGSELDGYTILPVAELANIDDCTVISVLSECFREVLTVLQQYSQKACLFYLADNFDYVTYVNSNKRILENQRAFKYIHIFPNEKFIKPFYNMLEDHFDMKEHAFIIDCSINPDTYRVYDLIHAKNEIYQNMLVIDDIHGEHNLIHSFSAWSCNVILASKQFECFIEKAERIYLHSAFLSTIGKKKVSGMAARWGQKMVWLCWGSDSLYDADSDIVKNVLQKVGKSYCALPRIENIKNRYKINAQENMATYCYIQNKNQSAMLKEKNSVNILLGHSAIPEMQHIYGMQLLYPYRNEDIQIYCPLSYGDRTYAKQVMEKGKEMFGDKFVPLLDFIVTDAYYAFLSEIDIAVFPMTRFFAGTTLSYLNAVGKKIYVNKHLVEYCKDIGITADDIEIVGKQQYLEFIQNDYAKCIQQEEIDKLNKSVVQGWKNIFE